MTRQHRSQPRGNPAKAARITEKAAVRLFPWVSTDHTGFSESLRHIPPHSAASFLINSNHSLFVVQKLLGHTQIETTARYSHLAPETMLNAADAMANAAGLGIPVVSDPISPDPVVPGLRLVEKENPGEEKEAA